MSSIEEKLQEWIVSEINGLCDASMISIPNIFALQQLTTGKNKKIWQYVIKHIKSKQTVRHVRNILRAKQAQVELNNLYPRMVINNDGLKQEIGKFNEKAEVVESSLSNLRKNIFKLKQFIKSLRERNYIISEKCTFLESEVLSYKKKDENLISVLQQLFSLFNILFSLEGINGYQNYTVKDSLEIFKIDSSQQPVDDTIRCLLFQMTSIVKNEMLNKGDKLSFLELTKSVKKIRNNANALDFISGIKQHLKQSEDLLEENNFLATSFASQRQLTKLRMSSEHLKTMKFDLVNSSFLRLKTRNQLNKMPSLEKVISNENIIIVDIENQTQLEFILMKARNVCLEENIKYLEKALSEKLLKTKNIVEKNNELKLKCAHLKFTVQNFYQMLECIRLLLETTPKTFLDTEKKLILSNEFLNEDLFSSLLPLKDDLNSCEVKNNLQLNYTDSLDILHSKHFLKSPLNYSNSDTLEIPDTIWKMLTMKPFNNLHLLCENLPHIKRKMTFKDYVLKCDVEEITEFSKCIAETLKNNLEHLKLIMEKAMTETKPKCQGLESFLNEWWYQQAQFIPEIVYDGKSLKMWIDILNCID